MKKLTVFLLLAALLLRWLHKTGCRIFASL